LLNRAGLRRNGTEQFTNGSEAAFGDILEQMFTALDVLTEAAGD
jgi:hypothetical protein